MKNINIVKPVPILPTVYGEELSYAEQLGKLQYAINQCIDTLGTLQTEVSEIRLSDAFKYGTVKTIVNGLTDKTVNTNYSINIPVVGTEGIIDISVASSRYVYYDSAGNKNVVNYYKKPFFHLVGSFPPVGTARNLTECLNLSNFLDTVPNGFTSTSHVTVAAGTLNPQATPNHYLLNIVITTVWTGTRAPALLQYEKYNEQTYTALVSSTWDSNIS